MNANPGNRMAFDAVPTGFWRRAWQLVKPYWTSEEKGWAWLLLVVVIGLSLFDVLISVLVNSWYRDFYNALEKKELAEFGHLLLYFSGIAAVAIVAAVYNAYLGSLLAIRWRRWLTERYFSRWLSHRNFYQLEQGGRTDNPDQRLTQDIDDFTSDTLSLGLGFISNVVSLVSFSVILWHVSGSIELLGITIPGYMFWCALLYSFAGTWLTHLIARRLIGLGNQQQRYEADLRFSLVRVRENAESVALYGGESNERAHLGERFGRVWRNFREIMRVQKRLTFFTSGYGQAAIIFPFLVAAPRYFAGKIELGEVMQINSAFGSVHENLSWFISAYNKLVAWKATTDRLLGFTLAMERNEQAQPGITVHEGASRLSVEGLSLRLDDGRLLFDGLDLTLKPGERVLLSGPSGSGKSSLLRTISGLWRDGQGQVEHPTGRSLYLPQRPYLPLGTLREVLAYPQLPGADEAAVSALERCRLGHLATRLDERAHWQQLLSPGEQQRLAFARALLVAPDYLFLDEATSAMDEHDETALYQALIEALPGLAMMSIGHRTSLLALHTRHLRLQDGRLRTATAAVLA